jgi:acylphosphatase
LSDVPCARFLVAGRVQGVFFRASARAEALRLGLGGHARNLADGRVEVLACGPTAALDAFERWLAVGPPAARVDAVVREALSGPGFSGFDVA